MRQVNGHLLCTDAPYDMSPKVQCEAAQNTCLRKADSSPAVETCS